MATLSCTYRLILFPQITRVDLKVRFDDSKSTVYEAFSGSDSGSASEESESSHRQTPPPSTKRRSVSRPADHPPKRRGTSRPRPDDQAGPRNSEAWNSWSKAVPSSSSTVSSSYTQVTRSAAVGPYSKVPRTNSQVRRQEPYYHRQATWKEPRRDNYGSDYHHHR